MKRMLLIGLGAVVVVAGIAAYLLYSNLGAIIVAAVEHYGSQATGTKVTLKGADVSGSTGAGTLHGLVVGNPPGYATPSAFRLGEVKLRVDLASAMGGGTVTIHEIGITAPEITYELGGAGGDNIGTIRKSVEGRASADRSAAGKPAGGGAAPAESKGAEKKIIIETLYVRDAKVVAAASALAGRSVSASLPPIQIKDIGKAKGGVTPAEAMNEVMAVLTRQIEAEVKKMGIEQVKGLAGSGATDLLNKAGGGAPATGAPGGTPAGGGTGGAEDMLRRVIGK